MSEPNETHESQHTDTLNAVLARWQAVAGGACPVCKGTGRERAGIGQWITCAECQGSTRRALTAPEAAARLRVPLGTYRNWLHGRRMPTAAVRELVRREIERSES